MAVATCGVFAVNSHTGDEPFLRDVLLYDKLVIPRPPPGDDEEEARWEGQDWDPDRQQRLIELLGTDQEPGWGGAKLAYAVDWNAAWQGAWRQHWAHGTRGTTPFESTAAVLKLAVPVGFSALEAVVPYESLKQFQEQTDFQPSPQGGGQVPMSTLVALVGRTLLLPSDDDHDEGLKAAIRLACDEDFVNQRAEFYDALRAFLYPIEDGSPDGRPVFVTDPRRVNEAVSGLSKKAEQYETFVRKKTGWRRANYAFTAIGFTAAGALAALNPIALAGVFASVGNFVAQRVYTGKKPIEGGTLAGAAMFVTARKELGWSRPA